MLPKVLVCSEVTNETRSFDTPLPVCFQLMQLFRLRWREIRGSSCSGCFQFSRFSASFLGFSYAGGRVANTTSFLSHRLTSEACFCRRFLEVQSGFRRYPVQGRGASRRQTIFYQRPGVSILARNRDEDYAEVRDTRVVREINNIVDHDALKAQ